METEEFICDETAIIKVKYIIYNLINIFQYKNKNNIDIHIYT